MPDQPQLIYLEPDDEITSLVRRLRAAESRSVVVVAPGRSRATSSAVALRLLAQVAAEEQRTLAMVADPATRALAAEAGIHAFASVAEATSGNEAPDHGAAAPRAPIHVVRGAADPVPAVIVGGSVPPVARSGPSDETVAVRLPPRPATGGVSRFRGGNLGARRWPWLAGLLVVVLLAAAALLPGASVKVTPATLTVGPRTYPIALRTAGRQTGDLKATKPGTPSGQRPELVPATGTVTFFNRSIGRVDIPQGTRVSVGGTIVFATTKKITVPGGAFFGDPGQKDVGVVAVAGGISGNVAAGAINTIEDPNIRYNRQVSNAAATTGGLEIPHTVIQQSDVDAVVTAIKDDLATQLAAALAAQPDRVYAGPPDSEASVIDVAPDLVGKEDTATFELRGTLAFDRPYVARTDVERAAVDKLTSDTNAIPSGKSLVANSVKVQIGAASASGDEMTVQVAVRAAAAAPIDTTAVRDLVAGMTVAQAQDALRDIGDVEVDLWPPWLDRLPRLSFRISIETVQPSPGPSPSS